MGTRTRVWVRLLGCYLLTVWIAALMGVGALAHAGQSLAKKAVPECVSGMRQKVGPHGKIPYYAPCFCQAERYPAIEKRMGKLGVSVRPQSRECEPKQGYCRCVIQLIWKDLPTEKQKALRCRQVAAAVAKIPTEDMPKMPWHQAQAILDDAVLVKYCKP